MLRVACLLAVCLAVCSGQKDRAINSAWKRFRQKKYAVPQVATVMFTSESGETVQQDEIVGMVLTLDRKEEKVRFQNFKKAYKMVNEINSENLDYVADLNDLSDLSDEEWNNNLMGLNMTKRQTTDMDAAPLLQFVREDGSPVEIPDTKDWVAEGKLTGIKFQGVCGACWAFAATTCLESHYAIYGGNLKFMSEQQMLDCVYPGEDACDGGWYSDGWKTVNQKLDNKVPTEKSYAYLGQTTRCDINRGSNALVAAAVDYPTFLKVEYEPSQSGPLYDQKLADAVAIGPVAVAMEIISKFKVYKGGLFSEHRCKNFPNHAVVVVGYTKDTFKLRNSWGTSWGEDGYFFFDRRVKNQCFIAQYAEYPSLFKTGIADESDKSDPCSNMQCLNFGVCAPNVDKTSAKCYCPVGYTGTYCEEKDCVDVLKRCPKTENSPKCQKRKYATKCPRKCNTCYN